MKVLVTGVAGFIGHFIGLRLAQRGDEVVGIDNLNSYYDVNLKLARLKEAGFNDNNDVQHSQKFSNYTFVKGDLSSMDVTSSIMQNFKFDAVCHLAAQPGVRYSLENPNAYIQNNVVAFANLLESVRQAKIKNLVYASSSSVYGLNNHLPFSVDDNVDHPVSLYAATKKSNELMAHAYSHLYDIQTTGLRFFTVYGPWGRPDMAPMLFLKAAFENKPIQVFNNGNMMRDFTYIDDIAEGVLRVLDNPAGYDSNWSNHLRPSTSTAPYRVFNLGNSSPIRLLDFLTQLEISAEIKIEKNMAPMQAGDVQATFADMNEFETLFHWKPNTSLSSGVGHFVQWYREFFLKKDS